MSFLPLPLEIRLEIYDLVFSMSNGPQRDNTLHFWTAHLHSDINRDFRDHGRHFYEPDNTLVHLLHPWDTRPDVALFFVSRAASAEATRVFYSRTTFMFNDRPAWADMTRQRLVSVPCIDLFLRQIGPVNAANLHNIRILHPYAWECPEPGAVALCREHVKVFRLIQTSCPALRRLELMICQKHGRFGPQPQGPDVDRADEPVEGPEAAAVLAAIDAAGPALMPSLREIKVLAPLDDADIYASTMLTSPPGPRWTLEHFDLRLFEKYQRARAFPGATRSLSFKDFHFSSRRPSLYDEMTCRWMSQRCGWVPGPWGYWVEYSRRRRCNPESQHNQDMTDMQLFRPLKRRC